MKRTPCETIRVREFAPRITLAKKHEPFHQLLKHLETVGKEK